MSEIFRPVFNPKMNVHGCDARYEGQTTTLIFKDPVQGSRPRSLEELVKGTCPRI